MSLYIQHGHGKSDKINQAIDEGTANGVIIAARNERIDKLDEFVNTLRDSHSDAAVLFDSQFFVSAITPANERFLDEYPFYESGRAVGDFVGARKLAGYAQSTLEFQYQRPFTRVTTPTVIVRSFADRWSQIALQLADSAIEYHAEKPRLQPLMVSILLSENALDDRDDLDAFLDIITSWEVHGFYITIAREDPAYSQMIEPDRLAHLLYMIYVLGNRNSYEVVCGYSDFLGIPCLAAGASAFATGWYQSLRQFHIKSFLTKKPGGQRPVLRYSSGPLLNSIRLSELESVFDARQLEKVLSGVNLDQVVSNANTPLASDWNSAVSDRHHWQTLKSLESRLTRRVKPDVVELLRQVRQSQGLLTLLLSQGVPFDKRSSLEQGYKDWIAGMQRFVSLAGI